MTAAPRMHEILTAFVRLDEESHANPDADDDDAYVVTFERLIAQAKAVLAQARHDVEAGSASALPDRDTTGLGKG